MPRALRTPSTRRLAEHGIPSVSMIAWFMYLQDHQSRARDEEAVRLANWRGKRYEEPTIKDAIMRRNARVERRIGIRCFETIHLGTEDR